MKSLGPPTLITDSLETESASYDFVLADSESIDLELNEFYSLKDNLLWIQPAHTRSSLNAWLELRSFGCEQIEEEPSVYLGLLSVSLGRLFQLNP